MPDATKSNALRTVRTEDMLGNPRHCTLVVCHIHLNHLDACRQRRDRLPEGGEEIGGDTSSIWKATYFQTNSCASPFKFRVVKRVTPLAIIREKLASSQGRHPRRLPVGVGRPASSRASSRHAFTGKIPWEQVPRSDRKLPAEELRPTQTGPTFARGPDVGTGRPHGSSVQDVG